jgi:hypothetical protein
MELSTQWFSVDGSVSSRGARQAIRWQDLRIGKENFEFRGLAMQFWFKRATYSRYSDFYKLDVSEDIRHSVRLDALLHYLRLLHMNKLKGKKAALLAKEQDKLVEYVTIELKRRFIIDRIISMHSALRHNIFERIRFEPQTVDQVDALISLMKKEPTFVTRPEKVTKITMPIDVPGILTGEEDSFSFSSRYRFVLACFFAQSEYTPENIREHLNEQIESFKAKYNDFIKKVEAELERLKKQPLSSRSYLLKLFKENDRILTFNLNLIERIKSDGYSLDDLAFELRVLRQQGIVEKIGGETYRLL